MKQKVIILLVAFFSFVLPSCIFMGPSISGNGHVVEENRKVKDFDGIKVSRGMNVYINQGDRIKVVVKADENLLDAVITEVEDGILKVYSEARIRKSKSKKVYVTVVDIESIKSSSGSNVYSSGTLKSENLELSCSSGANMKLEINANEVDASTSSGANMSLDGITKEFIGKSSSGANLKAGDLKTKNCQLETSSGANIWISVDGELDASASSGGNIYYYGSPKNTSIKNSSGGNIRKQ